MSIPPGKPEGTPDSPVSSSVEQDSTEDESVSGHFHYRKAQSISDSSDSTSRAPKAPPRRASFRRLSSRAKILEAHQKEKELHPEENKAISGSIPVPGRSATHRDKDWQHSSGSPNSASLQAFLTEVEQDDVAASLGRFDRAGSVTSETSLPDIQSKPFEYDRLLMFVNPDNPKSPLFKAFKKHFSVSFKAMPPYEQNRVYKFCLSRLSTICFNSDPTESAAKGFLTSSLQDYKSEVCERFSTCSAQCEEAGKVISVEALLMKLGIKGKTGRAIAVAAEKSIEWLSAGSEQRAGGMANPIHRCSQLENEAFYVGLYRYYF
ncbi:hypothetical protein GZ77_11575 [Endozoicomonas montiporae]|uniref:Uncharacterized protein n=2 Tax=Endozoicomonas montiporae TaxID=1027273 RepID=A0A081N8X2_9GAMM|nr:hypothetical protein [Endozoicomonas montiporae]AMO55183.1 hypothetical protein EZMO1_0969 [Endozoicomonas montiporae CL-33]KEQ14895.1 hypothetical protein GZ77_11575 [Endozoicomonas montiporae]